MAGVLNHLEMTSLICLVVDVGSKLLPQWDLSWGCWLKQLLEPFPVTWASLQHGGLRVVSLLTWWLSASTVSVCTRLL